MMDEEEERAASEISEPIETEQEAGMPEAGIQKGMFGEDKIVRPEGKGVATQISMDDLAKLEAAKQQSPEGEDDIADLFEGPQPEDNDMATDHLFAVDEPEDLSDLTDVPEEAVMGEELDAESEPEPEPQPQPRRYRIVSKGRRVIRREPPSPGIRGVNP